MLGVGGPRGLDWTTFSTLWGIRTLLVLVLRVRVARVGDSSPSSPLGYAIEALLSVRLRGLYFSIVPCYPM
jgi:hypothetical protein